MYLIEAVRVVDYFNKLSAEKKNALPIKVYYALRKVVRALSDDVNSFSDIREEGIKSIRETYFSEEKSDPVSVPAKDDSGNDVYDEEGNQVFEDARQVKPEFLEDYRIAMETLNSKLNELGTEKNTYEYNYVDIGDMVTNLPSNTPLDADDIDILDAIFTETVYRD